ncbi:MAG: hypothetical protein K8M05_14295 [Deltaproteobacteria bacterium]|nr:hypothetical protein [Kofleriaceae bacterium]
MRRALRSAAAQEEEAEHRGDGDDHENEGEALLHVISAVPAVLGQDGNHHGCPNNSPIRLAKPGSLGQR